MSGVKGRSGRRRNPRNALRYFNELYDAKSFELAEVTIEKALSGDREMLIYCHDRRMGKPKAQVDITSDGKELGVGIVTKIYEFMAAKRRELGSEGLLQGKDTSQLGEGQITGGQDAAIEAEK